MPAWAAPASDALPRLETTGLARLGHACQAGDAADNEAFASPSGAGASGLAEQTRQPDLPDMLCYRQLDYACSKPVG